MIRAMLLGCGAILSFAILAANCWESGSQPFGDLPTGAGYSFVGGQTYRICSADMDCIGVKCPTLLVDGECAQDVHHETLAPPCIENPPEPSHCYETWGVCSNDPLQSHVCVAAGPQDCMTRKQCVPGKPVDGVNTECVLATALSSVESKPCDDDSAPPIGP